MQTHELQTLMTRTFGILLPGPPWVSQTEEEQDLKIAAQRSWPSMQTRN